MAVQPGTCNVRDTYMSARWLEARRSRLRPAITGDRNMKYQVTWWKPRRVSCRAARVAGGLAGLSGPYSESMRLSTLQCTAPSSPAPTRRPSFQPPTFARLATQHGRHRPPPTPRRAPDQIHHIHHRPERAHLWKRGNGTSILLYRSYFINTRDARLLRLGCEVWVAVVVLFRVRRMAGWSTPILLQCLHYRDAGCGVERVTVASLLHRPLHLLSQL
jgi:hypothetical protein